MKKVNIVFCCILPISILGFIAYNSSTVTMSQSNKEAGFSESTLNSPQNSKIYSLNSSVNYNGENVEEFILSQTLPNIWIVLPDSNTNDTKINISEKAAEVLHKHWLIRLKHEYLRVFIGVSKGINYQKENTILLQSFIDTKDSLTKMPITIEAESRNFSSEEAYQLLGIIRDSSEKLVGEIKKVRDK